MGEKDKFGSNSKDKKIYIKPINDIVFKNLFGVYGNEKILIHFLNQILGRNKDNAIVSLRHLNTEIVGSVKLKDNSKKKRGRPSTKVKNFFTKTSNLDIYVESSYISENKTAINNNNITTDGRSIRNDNNDIILIDNNTTNSNDNISDNNNEDNDQNDHVDRDDDHNNDIDEMININDKSFLLYNNFKNVLDKRLDELINYFNEVVNNLLKKILENKYIILGEDIRKQINNILNKYKTNNESNYDFNFENTEINNRIDSFRNDMADLFKPKEVDNDNVINMEVTTKNNEIIAIEMQVNEDREMYRRSLYYASNIIQQSLPIGKEYQDLPKIIIINILNFNLLNGTKEEMAIPHWDFTIKDKITNEEKGFKDLLNIHFIELKKYKEYEVKHRNEMVNNYPWILFLNNPNDKYFKQDNIPKEYIKARERLFFLQGDTEFIDLYRNRERELMDIKSKMRSKLNEGIGIGEKKAGVNYLMKRLKKGEKLEKIKDDFLETFTEEELEIIDCFVGDESFTIQNLALQLGMDENIVLEICEKVNLAGQERKGKKQKSK